MTTTITSATTNVHEGAAEREPAQKSLATLVVRIRKSGVGRLGEAPRYSSAGAAGMGDSGDFLRVHFLLCQVFMNSLSLVRLSNILTLKDRRPKLAEREGGGRFGRGLGEEVGQDGRSSWRRDIDSRGRRRR